MAKCLLAPFVRKILIKVGRDTYLSGYLFRSNREFRFTSSLRVDLRVDYGRRARVRQKRLYGFATADSILTGTHQNSESSMVESVWVIVGDYGRLFRRATVVGCGKCHSQRCRASPGNVEYGHIVDAVDFR